ncbi:MAG TPA: hypothetical protein VGR62_20640 [Candidatus Binatia bacterium]|nr:hypothetical protein [Candidatus Binatia bacterium]
MIVALVGFGGVALGSWATIRDLKEQRRLEFVRTQLSELYSPLLAFGPQLGVAEQIYLSMRDLGLAPAGVGGTTGEVYAERYVATVLPLYQDMLAVFRKGLWLAEPSTRACFAKLVGQVSLLEQALAAYAPRVVIEEVCSVAHNAVLRDDIESHFGRLQALLRPAPPSIMRRMQQRVCCMTIRSTPTQGGKSAQGGAGSDTRKRMGE